MHHSIGLSRTVTGKLPKGGNKMSTQIQTIPFAGKSSFALGHAKKWSIQHLESADMHNQIPYIPDRYPSNPGLLTALDIAVRSKLLKAHLEDAFAQNIFSVVITRRKASPVLSVTHDSRTSSEMITKITELYLDGTTKYTVTKV